MDKNSAHKKKPEILTIINKVKQIIAVTIRNSKNTWSLVGVKMTTVQLPVLVAGLVVGINNDDEENTFGKAVAGHRKATKVVGRLKGGHKSNDLLSFTTAIK